jgi:hypothetical protein
MISLFSERPEPNQRPSSFVVSILAHARPWLSYLLESSTRRSSDDPVVTKRYTVRHLDLHTEKNRRAVGSQGHCVSRPSCRGVPKPQPGKKPAAHPSSDATDRGCREGTTDARAAGYSRSRKVTRRDAGADGRHLDSQEGTGQNVVAPLPEKATASDVKPSVNAPNEEMNLGDIGISSTDMPTRQVPVAPTTTSPLWFTGRRWCNWLR